jgi:tRNA (Thr-GGU) A37 N-methylase
MLTVTMIPIGTVRATRTATEDDYCDSVVSSIELDPEQFTTEALAALDTFSHIEVVYLFDRVDPAKVGTPDVRGTTRRGRRSESSRSEARTDRTESERRPAASIRSTDFASTSPASMP